MAKVKITVVKKLSHKDLYGENPPANIKEDLSPECRRFTVGQEFMIDSEKRAPDPSSWENCPPNFCGWAFADIQCKSSAIMAQI